MSGELAFFRKRAEVEWANADSATLDNVRERCTRAARSWEAMADRSEQFQQRRIAREAEAKVEPQPT